MNVYKVTLTSKIIIKNAKNKNIKKKSTKRKHKKKCNNKKN